MSDLILHIGLPKCGSTTIQAQWLNRLPGYLGRAPIDKRVVGLLTQFLRLSHINKLSSVRTTRLQQWASDVNSVFGDSVPENFILSSEALGKYLRQGYFPLFDFIATLQEKVWLTGQVKVVVVLRSQQTKILSQYVQKSDRRFNAGQDDLQKYIASCLMSEELEYSTLVKGLWSILGRKNVLVLFTEEMQSRTFWRSLSGFCGAVCRDEEISQIGCLNSRSRDGKVWGMTDPCSHAACLSFANTVLTWVWPVGRLHGSRNLMRNILVGVYRRVRKAVLKFELSRDSSVYLTEEVEQLIINRFRASNKDLEKMLNRDLSQLGY